MMVDRDMEIIERMLSNYKDYLSIYKRGGDWDIDSFMASVLKKVIELKETLETEEELTEYEKHEYEIRAAFREEFGEAYLAFIDEKDNDKIDMVEMLWLGFSHGYLRGSKCQ